MARCYDFHGAACILRAIADVLHCHVYDDMISDTRSQANDDGTSTELRDKFHTVLREEKIRVQQGPIADTSVFQRLANSSVISQTNEARTLSDCKDLLEATLAETLYRQLPYC